MAEGNTQQLICNIREMKKTDSYTKQLEKFMIIVSKKLNCLPDFTLPVEGNKHIFDKIDELKEAQRWADTMLNELHKKELEKEAQDER